MEYSTVCGLIVFKLNTSGVASQRSDTFPFYLIVAFFLFIITTFYLPPFIGHVVMYISQCALQIKTLKELILLFGTS